VAGLISSLSDVAVPWCPRSQACAVGLPWEYASQLRPCGQSTVVGRRVGSLFSFVGPSFSGLFRPIELYNDLGYTLHCKTENHDMT